MARSLNDSMASFVPQHYDRIHACRLLRRNESCRVPHTLLLRKPNQLVALFDGGRRGLVSPFLDWFRRNRGDLWSLSTQVANQAANGFPSGRNPGDTDAAVLRKRTHGPYGSNADAGVVTFEEQPVTLPHAPSAANVARQCNPAFACDLGLFLRRGAPGVPSQRVSEKLNAEDFIWLPSSSSQRRCQHGEELSSGMRLPFPP